MSAYKNSHDDVPKLEPWLIVLASSVLPVIAAIFLSGSLVVPAVVVSVMLFVTGLVMLRRQNAERRPQTSTSLEAEA